MPENAAMVGVRPQSGLPSKHPPNRRPAMIWTLLSVFVVAPLGALAFDRPVFGNWIWRIDPEKAFDFG